MQLTPDLLLGVVSGLAGSAVYAVSVVVYKSQSDEIRPLAVSSLKMWIAFPLMLFLIVLPFVPSPFAFPIETVVLLALSIIFGAVIGDTVYLTSQERIGVSYAFPISMSFPILTYLLTLVFLGEQWFWSRFIGIVIAVVGVVILTLEQENDEEPSEGESKFDFIGITLAIITAILYALGTTILQVATQNPVIDVNPISANFVRITIGSLAFLPMMAVARTKGMPLPSKRVTKIIAITGLFGMGFGSILYVTAVTYAGAAITSVIASTAPLFAVPISVIFLKERLTVLTVIGILATVFGVILVVIGI